MGHGSLADDAHQGFLAEGLGLVGRHDNEGGRAVVQLRGVGGGDGAVLIKRRPQGAHLVERRLEGLFILVDDEGIFFALRHLDGCHLRVELAGFHSCLGPLVGSQSEGVLLFAGHLVFGRGELAAVAHVLVAVRIPQSIPNHRVLDLEGTHAITATGALEKVRREGHRLHAARDNSFPLLGTDAVGCVHDGPQSRSTNLV